jgi:glucose/arabinose dehydrogenase
MSGHGLMLKHKWLLVVSIALLLGLSPLFVSSKPASGASTLPTGFSQTPFAVGLSEPTAMAFAPDGRLFVAEQGGTLRVVNNGQLLPTPFLNISSKVDSSGERGLLGIAFDPEFANNKYVYVYYTQKATSTIPPFNRVARFTADANNGDVAAPNSEQSIFELPYLAATNHNGGAIHFGADGKLYVAVGENARPAEAQSLNSLLGKMLRINKEVEDPIPADNPFYTQTTGNNRAIWALGLRNPYSFDVQPDTGTDPRRIFINDVGQSAWEEIDEGIAGANYGWPLYEGPVSNPPISNPPISSPISNPPISNPISSPISKSKKHHHKHRGKHRHKHRHKPSSATSASSSDTGSPSSGTGSPSSGTGPSSSDTGSPSSDAGLLLYAYPHSLGCAITGGAFYNPPIAQPPFPADYVGDYFFADFCGGWISKFDPTTNTVTDFKSASSGQPVEQPVDLKVSTEGDLYFLARGTGSVEKISSP